RLADARWGGEDRRPDASAAIREDPAVARGVKAVHPFPEVLDHVGPFELTVDQHVEAFGLLPGDRVADQPFDAGLVRRLVDLATGKPDPQLAHLRGLRQGPGACGRKLRSGAVGLTAGRLGSIAAR